MSSALHPEIDWTVFTPLATTVLYEGHVLYPYRRSALKNRQRWNFGTLFPPAWSDEPSDLTLEALIEDAAAPEAEVRLYFLLDDGSEHNLGGGTRLLGPVRCQLEWTITLVEPGLWKLGVHAANLTAAPASTRQAMLALALHSAHLRCALRSGAFVSAQDPGRWQTRADQCHSRGVYPVLAGPPGQRRYLLAAPIILEDHARIAPQSRGEFCDATEIDELLTLRVLTLTDAEKAEALAAGGLAGHILARCAAEADTGALHGGLQSLEHWEDAFAAPPASVRIGTRAVQVGERVRIRLGARQPRDIFEQTLDGRTGVVQAIEQDLEGGLQLAIIADDDPGRDLGELRQTGHRFFFSPDELEPL